MCLICDSVVDLPATLQEVAVMSYMTGLLYGLIISDAAPECAERMSSDMCIRHFDLLVAMGCGVVGAARSTCPA